MSPPPIVRVTGLTAKIRLQDARYIKPTDRVDVCIRCILSEVYLPTADKGKLHCTRLRAYVQSYGICDEYVPPPTQKRG